MQDKSGVPGQCARAAVSDQLARTLRAGHDRGDGLRYAGDRLELRLGSGVIDDGVTGFIVESEEQALAAIAQVPRTGSPRACAPPSSGGLPPQTMAEAYVNVYAHIVRDRSGSSRMMSFAETGL